MTQEALFPMPQQSNTSDDYWTPKWIFDALGIEFDLDVACPPEGPAHTPAKAFYTQETDGLASPWYGNVWMNPPFSKLTPWTHKFIQHKNGICLLPYSKSKWFNYLWDELQGIVSIPRGQAAFVQGDIFLPCFLGAMGDQNLEALHRSKIGRVR
jgi:phage N-6-adenine-methyltransferase